MSANTGTAPARSMASTVANAVMGVVITSAPGPIPDARNPILIASRAFPVPTQYGTFRKADHARSNSRTSSPRIQRPDSITRRAAAASESLSSAGSDRKSFRPMAGPPSLGSRTTTVDEALVLGFTVDPLIRIGDK